MSALAKPKRSRAANLDRPNEARRAFRASPRGRAGSSGRFDRLSDTERGLRRADFERPSDAERGQRGDFERSGGAERVRAAQKSQTSEGTLFLSVLVAPGHAQAAISSARVLPEQARAADFSAPAKLSGLEVGNVGKCGVLDPARPNETLEHPKAPVEIESPVPWPMCHTTNFV